MGLHLIEEEVLHHEETECHLLAEAEVLTVVEDHRQGMTLEEEDLLMGHYLTYCIL